MVMKMANNTDIKIGRYVVKPMPLILVLLMGFLCFSAEKFFSGQQAIISQMQKENASLSKRLTASDLKRRDAEQQLAQQQPVTPPGVVIISPDGSRVHTFEAPRALSTFQKDVVF